MPTTTRTGPPSVCSLRFERTPDRWGKALFAYRGRTYAFAVDQPAGHIYSADGEGLIRLKGFCLLWGSPPFFLARAAYHLARGDIPDALRSLLYGAALTGVALYVMAVPHPGRRLYGRLERRLNGHSEADRKKGVSFFHLFRAGIYGARAAVLGKPLEPLLRRWRQELAQRRFYVATCFQPVSRVDSARSAETLKKHRLILYRMKKTCLQLPRFPY